MSDLYTLFCLQQSLQDQLKEVKKKKKDEFHASEGSSKDDNTSCNQDLCPRNTIEIAWGSFINGVFEDR